MKKFSIAILTLLLSLHALAQNVVQSNLLSATVYTQGAMLQHTVSLVAERGAQVVQISGVSSQIDPSSIMIALPSQSHLVSVSTKVVNAEKKNMNYEEQVLVDSFESMTIRQLDLKDKISTEQFAVELIKKNDQLFSSKENNTDDVVKAYNDYRKLLTTSLKNIQSANIELEKLNNKIALLKSEITSRGIWTTNKTVLEVALQNDNAGTLPIKFSYYTPSCRWTPSYRITNTDAQPSVDIEYKASITQNTGFDWKNVNLSVSTGNPQIANTQPTITAWYLRYQSPQYGNISYQNNGRAYKSANYETADKEEVSVDAAAPLPIETSNLISTTVFEINTPYDVKTGNQPVLAHLKNYQVPAIIYFYTVPKLDKEVYMLASFTMDQAAELLPGEALIMNSGDYVGKTQLDPYAVSDTMRLSLGRTPSVQVKRDVIKASCKTATIGNKTTTTRYYSYDVYNGLSRDIRLVIKDNVPISTDNSIEVKIEELSGGNIDDNSKIVTWDFDLGSRSKKSFQFGYEVKHLKDRPIPGL